MKVKYGFLLFLIFWTSCPCFADTSPEKYTNVPINPFLLLIITISALIGLFFLSYLYLETRKKLAASERKNESLQLQNPLHDRNEELSMILRRVAHDLKEFLVNIEELAHISLLESENSPIHEYLHMQLEVLGKTKLLLFRVMEIERIREHSVKKINIHLPDYLRGIIRSMRRIDGGRDIDILVDMPEALFVFTDPDMLEIVFDNLIRNTIEHNYPSEKPLRMNIIGRDFSQTVQVSIADNGRGIPEELHEKIFGLFISNLNKKLGFGLGLYKTKLALEKTQGQIQLIPSEKGETVFHIVLPKK